MKQRQCIQELEIEGLEATVEAKERTSQGEPVPLDPFAEIAKQQKALRDKAAADLAKLDALVTMTSPAHPLRLHKPFHRVLENMSMD